MGKLIFSMITSVDGYVADAGGNFAWGEPSEQALAAINADIESVDTYLYGRHMYDTMAVWETDRELTTSSPQSSAFAERWVAANKLVYSTSLTEVRTERTTLLRSFDPQQVRELKESVSGDLTIDGPTVAAHAFAAGLVDEVHLLVCPLTVGAGLAWAPPAPLRLDLFAHRAFDNDMVQLKYRVRHPDHDVAAAQ